MRTWPIWPTAVASVAASMRWARSCFSSLVPGACTLISSWESRAASISWSAPSVSPCLPIRTSGFREWAWPRRALRWKPVRFAMGGRVARSPAGLSGSDDNPSAGRPRGLESLGNPLRNPSGTCQYTSRTFQYTSGSFGYTFGASRYTSGSSQSLSGRSRSLSGGPEVFPDAPEDVSEAPKEILAGPDVYPDPPKGVLEASGDVPEGAGGVWERAGGVLERSGGFPEAPGVFSRGRRARIGHPDEPVRLHPRPFLPAATGEPVAGGGRGAGLGLPVPRLERAHRRRVLRPQRPRPHLRRRGANRADRQQLRADQLQLRPHPPLLDGGQGPRDLLRRARRRPPEPRALLRPRLRPRPGLPPQHPAARQPARQADRDPLGARRLRPSLRPSRRGVLAAGDGGRPGNPRDPGRGGGPLRSPGAPPGPALPSARPGGPGDPGGYGGRGGLAGGAGGDRRPGALSADPPLEPDPRPLLLRRRDLARHRLRGAPGERRDPDRPHSRRLLAPLPRRRTGPGRARPPGDRRRDLRPPPPLWRHGPGLCPAPPGGGPRGHPHQLWRVPGAPSARAGSRDPREHLLELRPRDRTVEERLRLLDRGSRGVESGLARPPARRPGRSPRRDRPAL